VAPAGPIARSYRAILTEGELVVFCDKIRQAPVLAIDTETTGLDAARARIVGISLSIDPAEGVYLPLGHDWGLDGPKQLSLDVVRQHLGPILAADSPPKAGHNLKFDEIVLQQAGFTLGAVAFDSMLASYLLDPEGQHGLKEVVKRELGETMTTYDQVTSKQRGKQTPFSEVELGAATAYAGADAAFSLDLMRRLLPRLEGEGMLKLLVDVELPLARVLVAMEQRGVLVDIKVLARLARQFDAKLIELEALAKQKAGRDFNVNSPRQLETLLFDDLGLTVIKRTKTGRSTDAEVLEALAEQHELPKVILELRQIAKLKGTYVDALPGLVNPRTGRIHTSYNQAVAATGRLSSSDPNFQNIPSRTDIGRSIREAFIAPEGMTLVSADYSQIELRLLAHFSRDPGLCDAFVKGDDIHTRTAAEMFDKPVSEVTPDMRRAAKTINFGVIYGMGDAALAKRLGIEREEAARFIETYFKRYAGVKAYFDKVLEEARSAGSVGTLLGRRRFLPELSSANRGVRLQAERVAQNTPIQGTAADILKLAMIALREPLVPGARMILTVHDELVFEVPLGQEKQAAERARAAMEGVVQLSVPLLVEVGHGHTWTEAH
jgi:DNA polymerase-1